MRRSQIKVLILHIRVKHIIMSVMSVMNTIQNLGSCTLMTDLSSDEQHLVESSVCSRVIE